MSYLSVIWEKYLKCHQFNWGFLSLSMAISSIRTIRLSIRSNVTKALCNTWNARQGDIVMMQRSNWKDKHLGIKILYLVVNLRRGAWHFVMFHLHAFHQSCGSGGIFGLYEYKFQIFQRWLAVHVVKLTANSYPLFFVFDPPSVTLLLHNNRFLISWCTRAELSDICLWVCILPPTPLPVGTRNNCLVFAINKIDKSWLFWLTASLRMLSLSARYLMRLRLSITLDRKKSIGLHVTFTKWLQWPEVCLRLG